MRIYKSKIRLNKIKIKNKSTNEQLEIINTEYKWK